MEIGRWKAAERRVWHRWGDGLLAVGLAVSSLGLYLQTLAPSVSALFDDSLEFPLVVQRLAVAHPTGYPLYILLGKLFSLGPWQNVPWALNLLSAVAAAATIGWVYLVARQLTRRSWPALLGAAALAVSPLFWSQAVVAEVYTLNSAFVAALLWLALRWARLPLAPVRPFSLLQADAPKLGHLRRIARRERRHRPDGGARTAPNEPALSVGAVGAGSPDPAPAGIETKHVEGASEEIEVSGGPAGPRDTLLARVSAGAWQALAWSRQAGRQMAAWAEPILRWMASWSGRAIRRAAALAAEAGRRVGNVYRRFFPPVPAARRLRPHPRLYALAAVCGLSLTHHRTALLLAPALLLFGLLVERRILARATLLGPEYPERPGWQQFAGRPVTILAACFLLPLLLYLYLPIRGLVGSLDGTYANTWGGLWRWVAGSSYNLFLGDNPLARDLDASFYGRLFWHQFGPVGLALALVGAIGLARQPKALALTGLALASYVAFAVAYRVPDVEVFFIPALVVVSVWIAAGLDYGADRLRIRGPSLAGRRLLALSGLALALAATAQPWLLASRNYPDLDLSRRWSVHDWGRFVLAQPLPQGSTVIGLLGEMTLLRTFQETAALRRDVQTVAADDEAARRREVEDALRAGEAVYLTRPLPGLDADYSLDVVIGLVDVGGELEMLLRVDAPPEVAALLGPATEHDLLGGSVRVVGVEVGERRAHWQAWARLRLRWQALEVVGEVFKVSARLVAPGGQMIAAVDAEPVGGAYPATSWRPGEIVTDLYEIPLPAGTPPGVYTPLIILYDPATGAERDRIEGAPVRLEGNPARPPRRALEVGVAETVYARFGDTQLLGFTPPDPAATHRPGEPLPLTLLWQAPNRPGGEWALEFWLEGAERYSLDAGLGSALGGAFPARLWQGDQVVRQWVGLGLPPGTPPGAYRLKMRVLREGRPVPWGGWLLPRGSDLELGAIQILP